MKKLITFLFFLAGIPTLFAQSETEFKSFYWPKYNSILSFNEEYILLSELEGLRSFSPDRQRQALARITFMKQVSNTLVVGLGVANNRIMNLNAELWEPEWRTHQQVELLLKKNRLQFEHRLRVEQQFIRGAHKEKEGLYPGHRFTLRTRYQVQLIHNFREQQGNKNNLAAFIRDEVYLFPAMRRQFLSQNRVSSGIIFQPYRPLSFELSYMFMLLKTNHSEYEYRNVINLAIAHYLSL